MGKPVLSLKQFMLRSEVLKLYRGYMRLGRLLNDPPSLPVPVEDKKGANPMRDEWTHWVRSEFRLRQNVSPDEEMTRALLVHGKRQLQEMERTIMLATNRNSGTTPTPKKCSETETSSPSSSPKEVNQKLESNSKTNYQNSKTS